ncbi:unnamed protein product [Periconia digitata]|uniref:DUF2415 domain-containing protein n=1 Tax=Periconia digitata TaxID=1303443 RepID=A0A9W4UII1_9PLEO|nr:unnamed protein product [Periconia digitata]
MSGQQASKSTGLSCLHQSPPIGPLHLCTCVDWRFARTTTTSPSNTSNSHHHQPFQPSWHIETAPPLHIPSTSWLPLSVSTTRLWHGAALRCPLRPRDLPSFTPRSLTTPSTFSQPDHALYLLSMAVDDFLSRDTDTFVLPSKSYYYPLKIPIAHYQLRHFISSSEPDLLYYASRADVFCLNAATRTQTQLTTLPWDARCTASGYGYVCVGGAQDGNFAAIKVTGFPPADPAHVDALLPLDLSNRITLPRPPAALLPTHFHTEFAKIGDDIVNSISIHKLSTDGAAHEDVVAVLTNNDKSVRIYSLTENVQIAELWLPFPMNHATISPDGQLLVAVGDQHVGYFFQRTRKGTVGTDKTTEEQPTEWRWTLIQEVCLYVPPESSLEGYFTTAWSPSGRLCAVGSECGYITVFDVDLLMQCEYGEDAILHVISSTRPDMGVPGPGAVRTMQFSPAPWDFLVWSEDQARVCIADLRSDLKVKQVLTLDPKEDGLEKVHIADFDLDLNPALNNLQEEEDFIRRYHRTRDTEGNAAAVSLANDYMDSADRRRYHRHSGVVESTNDPHGLTAHERQVLETLRTTRPRESTRDAGSNPRSINYNTSTGSTDARGAATRVITETATGMSEALNQRHEWRAPRRQASVVVSLEGNNSGSRSQVNITGGATTRSPNPIAAQIHGTDLSQARREHNEMLASTDDAWRTIEEALARNARDTTRSSAAPELRNELRRLRQLTAMRERLRNARETPNAINSYTLSSMGFRRAHNPIHHNPADGLRTAGLAMSPDGRTLYCGTEEGIFEFHFNLHARKMMPAIAPR